MCMPMTIMRFHDFDYSVLCNCFYISEKKINKNTIYFSIRGTFFLKIIILRLKSTALKFFGKIRLRCTEYKDAFKFIIY